ncbi:hypothetical protein H5410_037868 [Solanum commersonii]|uniref:Uncharacterized protein n=1 Tax=Solanum commersonii TaxID=4109 RepID=A0A9J5YBG9_SOLCO|nr:hypothetical protein H5410_037868 [Solanum commersonii]
MKFRTSPGRYSRRECLREARLHPEEFFMPRKWRGGKEVSLGEMGSCDQRRMLNAREIDSLTDFYNTEQPSTFNLMKTTYTGSRPIMGNSQEKSAYRHLDRPATFALTMALEDDMES